MASFSDFLYSDIGAYPIIRTVVLGIIFLILFNAIIMYVKAALLKRATRKKQISNIKIFTRIARYSVFLLIVIFALISYGASWLGVGVAAGLLSAALGWALQRPITGIAGWLMVVILRPFDIGDWIILAGVRGEVSDITLTHIYLKEIGGLASSEENSGRIILVPNSILFEQNITNYTHDSDYSLDEIVVPITFGSDLNEAIKLGVQSAERVLKEMGVDSPEKPYVRTYFQASGINLHLRYFAQSKRRQEISSRVTQEMYSRLSASKKVQFAHPHTKIIYDPKRKDRV